MALEIERKFLVRPGWKPEGSGTRYLQGYLYAAGDGVTVRARLAGNKAFLTVKGPAEGVARLEFEYPIPPADAQTMLSALAVGGVIEKTRHRVEHAGRTWEVDVFQGRNSGLILAELELTRQDERIVLPDWIAEEVSHDHRYKNAYLARHPWPEWTKGGACR